MIGAASAHREPVSAAIDPEAFLFEQLGLIRMHAGLAQTYLEAGDTAGFAYSLKSLAASTVRRLAKDL
ncbi:hypothetical protein QO058_09405 [Bosea vestrisii]|uniref:hypothetical protein n=1 Tax=Bosea vestrisii TaxID=151416 RepID=UPI0024DF6358|nr:hypothetical protein [Bosea vestrisii]WID98427.1 hypothetical protein QO058_09405 [Bosea vestrisii]